MAKISIGAAKALRAILRDGEISGGEYNKSKKILSSFLADKVISRKNLTKVRFKIVLKDKDDLETYLLKKHQIKDLDIYIDELSKKDTTRHQFLKGSTNDKGKSVNPKKGMHVKGTAIIEVCGEQVKLSMQDGLTIHIVAYQDMRLSPNALVVGVENFENLSYIKSQLEHFEQREEIIFVNRDDSMREWISGISNDYIHYGDFDYAGISIFKNDILPRVRGDASFFIPDNIEELIDISDSELFYKQFNSYDRDKLMGISDELDKLIEIIYSKKKTARQESLI